MHVFADDLRLSPSDFSAFLGCRLRTGLDLAVARGLLAKPRSNAVGLQALRDRGEQHEQAYVQHLRDQGLTVVEIDTEAATAARAAATVQAMHQGADAIIQAALVNDTWTGYADVLRRVETASALGAWSYEPYDTKLARETRGGTILQLALYIDVLAGIQGLAATHFHVVTPAPSDGCSFTTHSYRYDDFAAYVRLVRDQFARTLALGHDIIQAANYPEPVEQCDVCRWWERCNGQRRKDDHLSFIAGVTRANREELVARGYPTLTAAAGIPLPIPFKPSRGSTDTYVRLRDQARLQHLQRTRKAPVHELLPVIDGQGLSRLPEPSPGDLFLDLEGARFAREGGREYLFGLSTNGSLTAKPGAHATNGGDSPSQYDCWWAFDDTEERAAFEALIDRIMQAWDADPNLHIYHFGHYEPSTLKRLMGRYATRGDELDRLLRAERFVDLHVVVRQALRAGVESYSIKQLEQFYEFTRDVLLHDAGMNLHAIELSLESNAAAAIPDDVRAAVRGYNRDDCRSTLALRNWLERLRAQVVDGGAEIHRPTPKEGEASEAIGELEQRQRDARERILAAISSDASTPEHPQHPNWLLAYLIDWHRREDKCAYWEFYRLRDLPECDLFDEAQAIAGLHHVARLSEERYKKGTLKSVVDRYAYPLQETEIRRRKGLRLPGGDPIGSLLEHDRVARTVDIQKGPKVADVHPPAVYQAEVIGTTAHQEALLRFAAEPDAINCGTDLLFRRPPRLRAGHEHEFAPRSGETTAQRAVRLAPLLDATTLAIQGPPGAGKTYVGAEMIRALVRAGKKVGVTGASHKVIRNLLDAIAAQDPTIALGHRCRPDDYDDDDLNTSGVRELGDNDAALEAVASGEISVLGGTSWLWSREEAAGAVDVLFVDEAGQMSLANALAVSGATRSLVLLGDPQQLEQPQQGGHPDGVGVSALEHVLGGALTMPPDRGLFLPTTWRLHPTICSYTSEVFYEGKLEPKPGLEHQRLVGSSDFDGAGLWWVSVEHEGNQNYSPEEVDVVERIVDQLLALGVMWVDEDRVAHQLTANDLRIVAPFNAQVNRLSERLGHRGVPVGTVDKFQGQEAPVVIYSMATSRPEDAPRGMEFLYSLNRFNVATSRARCAAIVVASPRLAEPACHTPRQMTLANALCRFRELARLASLG